MYRDIFRKIRMLRGLLLTRISPDESTELQTKSQSFTFTYLIEFYNFAHPNPASKFSSVVFPAPDGPMIAVSS